MNLLEDIIVVDLSQFLSGPSATLRLADMGAQVIKIEKPIGGDICRQLYVSDVVIEGESTIFHTINRNKQGYAADLKNPEDLEKVKKIIAKADVVIHNFRPGVIERLGLDYKTIKEINPGIVYAEISGYGELGPYKGLPGQDLLLQAASGLSWLTNNKTEPPTPMGVSVVDIVTGAHAAQGILAALYQRLNTGEGSLVQVSMFESVMDFQFEVLTCFYNDGNELPVRSEVNSGHAYIAAPYGIYQTADGFLALAMGHILTLGNLLSCEPLLNYTDSTEWFTRRDEIKAHLRDHLITQPTNHWLSILEPADIWCAEVLDYDTLRAHEAYQVLDIELDTKTANGVNVTTIRCPIRINGSIPKSDIGAPLIGQHNEEIDKQFAI